MSHPRGSSFPRTNWARPIDIVNRIPKSAGAPMQTTVAKPGVQNRRSPTTHKNTIVTHICTFTAGTGVTATQSPKVFVYSPSARLRIAIQIAFEDAQIQQEPVVAAPATWVIKTMARNPLTGRESILQQAYPVSGSANLPDGYEADTAADILRLDLTLNKDGFGQNRSGALKCITTWEPTVEIPLDELNELYSRCSVSVGTVPEINNGT